MTDVGDYFNKQGFRHKQGKYLTVECVIQIFAMLSCNVPVAAIGAHFAVSQMMVYHIKNGARWGWVRNKLMEEVPGSRLKHTWIPDEGHAGRFKCQECGLRYDQIMMNTQCPVAKTKENQPLYMSWKIPEPKKHKNKTSIPGADLKRVRQFNKQQEKLNKEFADRQAKKQAKRDAKEQRKQELLKELQELRDRNTIEETLQGKNFSQTGARR